MSVRQRSLIPGRKVPTKYRNVKTDGYDSRKEAKRAADLKLLEAAGEISGLREKVRFELLPAQYAGVNGKRRCVERAVVYVADFTYYRRGSDRLTVEDVKSPSSRTPQYVIKRKLMRYHYALPIEEV